MLGDGSELVLRKSGVLHIIGVIAALRLPGMGEITFLISTTRLYDERSPGST